MFLKLDGNTSTSRKCFELKEVLAFKTEVLLACPDVLGQMVSLDSKLTRLVYSLTWNIGCRFLRTSGLIADSVKLFFELSHLIP